MKRDLLFFRSNLTKGNTSNCCGICLGDGFCRWHCQIHVNRNFNPADVFGLFLCNVYCVYVETVMFIMNFISMGTLFNLLLNVFFFPLKPCFQRADQFIAYILMWIILKFLYAKANNLICIYASKLYFVYIFFSLNFHFSTAEKAFSVDCLRNYNQTKRLANEMNGADSKIVLVDYGKREPVKIAVLVSERVFFVC